MQRYYDNNSQKIFEGRTKERNHGNPDEIYWKKIDLFTQQKSWYNLKVRWKDRDREEIQDDIMRILMHNFPYADRENGFGFFKSMMKSKMPWGENWVAGINHEFNTLLTMDIFEDCLDRCQEWTNRQYGVDDDKKWIEMMESDGARGRKGKPVEGVVKIAGSFRELYLILTDPTYAKTYGKKYVSKSMEGRRGRPVPGGTYIEFTMKKLPVVMLRGKWPFSDYDSSMKDCYAVVGMAKPENKDDITKWLTSLKSLFRKDITLKGMTVDYKMITPCSLDYWMEEIERREFTATELLGYSKNKTKLFKPTSKLQLREDGSFRFYNDKTGMKDNEGWLPDPMQDKELISIMPDEFGKKTIHESAGDEVVIEKVGEHFMDGGLYKDQEGNYYCDCFNRPEPDGTISVCRLSPADDPEGEPDFTVNARCVNTDDDNEINYKFQYQMLSRLIDDARAYFNNPHDFRYHNDNAIYGDSIISHMKRVREYYDQVPIKPQWCTLEEIEELEKKAAAADNSDGTDSVNESVMYSTFTEEGKKQIDSLVKSLSDAKTATEKLLYHDGMTINDSEEDNLQDIHFQLCRILDMLPW